MKSMLVGLAVLAVSCAGPALGGEVRSYVAGHFALELDGLKQAGFLKSIDGGGIKAEVVTENTGAGVLPKKHLGLPNYPEFELQVDLTLAAGLEPWIDSMLSGNLMRKNGEITSTGASLLNQQFFNALLTEVGIPAADAADKDVAYMTVKFAPEQTEYTKVGVIAPIDLPKKQKLFLPSNFRLEIDGLDCTRVSKIDAFTIKQKLVESDVGDSRDYFKEPGEVEIPNLVITFAESSQASWFAWFEKFLIQGNNGDGEEKSGRLVFLSPNLQEEILEVKFSHLGIFKLTPDKAEANSDSIKRVTAELYCEEMSLNFKVGTVQ